MLIHTPTLSHSHSHTAAHSHPPIHSHSLLMLSFFLRVCVRRVSLFIYKTILYYFVTFFWWGGYVWVKERGFKEINSTHPHHNTRIPKDKKHSLMHLQTLSFTSFIFYIFWEQLYHHVILWERFIKICMLLQTLQNHEEVLRGPRLGSEETL